MLRRNALPNRTMQRHAVEPLSAIGVPVSGTVSYTPRLQGEDEVVELVIRQACCQGSSMQFDPQEGESRG